MARGKGRRRGGGPPRPPRSGSSAGGRTGAPTAPAPRRSGEGAQRAAGAAPGRAEVRGGRPSQTASHVALEWTRTILGALAIYFVVQAFILQAFRIPSGSMEDTLLVGDWLFVNKALYGPKVPLTNIHLPALSEPQRGGIVVFQSPIQEELNLVKRVIGVGGDTLAMRDGQLFLNGERRPEPYAKHANPAGDASDPGMRWQARHLAAGSVDPALYHPTRDDWGPLVVPPGRFFMMGDNRDASYDSRYYGFVQRNLIKGKPLFIYYSYDPRSPRPLPFLTAIRWYRIGSSIR